MSNINLKIMRLKEQIIGFDYEIQKLQYAHDKNRDLYLEGYGEGIKIEKIMRQLEREIEKCRIKREKVVEKLNKLQKGL